MKKCKENSREFVSNGTTFRIAAFNVDKVFSNGNMKAGCHLVPFSESKAIAKQLNW